MDLTTTEHVTALTDDELAEIFVDKRSSGQGEFVSIDFDAVVKVRTGRTKQTLQVLWARYTSTPAQAGQRHYITIGSASWLPPMSMRRGLPPALLTHQGIRCRWIGRGDVFICVIYAAYRAH
mgnify:CR=1 FL=1